MKRRTDTNNTEIRSDDVEVRSVADTLLPVQTENDKQKSATLEKL